MRNQETINRAYEIVEKFDFTNRGFITRTEFARDCDNCTLYIDIEDNLSDDVVICAMDENGTWLPLLINPTNEQVKNLIKALNS